jgi:hypothetical protein
MSNVATPIICLVVPALLRWIYNRSARGTAIITQDSVSFPESKLVPIIRWSGLVLFSAAAFASWTYGLSLLATGIFAGFALLSIFARGEAITVNSEGISGASIWGRSASLKWSDVASLEFNTGNRNTMVIGKDGARICHSGFHLDQPRFEAEVKRRTGLQVKVIQPGTWKPKVSYR